MSELTDYTDLVTSAHNDKPNFLAVLAAVLQPFVDEINTLESIPEMFDLDVAVGDQLSTVGQWIGLGRSLKVPIGGIYFSFDTAGSGFDQGVWFDPGDPVEGAISLDDDNYRLMLRAKIAANLWDGSLGDANTRLSALFTGGSVRVIDNFNMTMTVEVTGTAPSVLFSQLVAQGYLQFKPAAVGLLTSINVLFNQSVENVLFFESAEEDNVLF